ncbi:hypothetical protein CDEST_09773 [Colletotrichum destructivum]|uniref:Uncharacterized protein n=1 Tax=Colletotrichum destructivum TaxID=34406 RepID=A0AAX4IPG9_9PEZI|nr:hypothetical protein CDEST_09773 [Colletotrichum destructivum]
MMRTSSGLNVTKKAGPVIDNPRELVKWCPQAEYRVRWERGKSILSQKAHKLSPGVLVRPLAPHWR